MQNQNIFPEKGLTGTRAAKDLLTCGPNEIPTEESHSLPQLIIQILKEPMFLLLIISSLLYLVLGKFSDGMTLIFFVLISAGFTIYQEGKTSKALKSLSDLSNSLALAVRDKEIKKIPSREIVPEDIIILDEGAKVPADGVLLSANNLLMNESLLTGESMSIQKNNIDKDLNSVYSGSLVVKGHGVAQVTATGIHSKIGKIGNSLKLLKEEISPLNKQVSKLVKNLTLLGLALSSVLVFFYGQKYGDWLQAVLAGITLIMAILPQEYIMVMTIFPALGAWRLSKINVLTRRLSAIETLGAISVLCVDKTGTLTENRMQVAEIYTTAEKKLIIDDKLNGNLPEEFHDLIEIVILASLENPTDPMEIAFHDLGNHYLSNTEHLHADWILAKEYDISEQLRAMSHLWKSKEGHEYLVAAKGSPEAIIDLCHLNLGEQKKIEVEANLMAQKGLRILGVAKAKFKGEGWPNSEHDFVFEFCGLVGLLDPLRKEVSKSVQECYQAGIKLIMITGDYPITAKSIALKAGFEIKKILTGDEIKIMNDKDLQESLKTTNICARISPDQKLRIVNALKESGEITGMTGDGINDAPALRSAHVGIAMGKRGTDVARESASIILLDDNFISILKAIEIGRLIFENMKKSMIYLLAIHIPIAGMALIPILFNWPVVLFPIHVVFLELIIDPACTLAFENETEVSNLMHRSPRDTKAELIGGRTLLGAILHGLVSLLLVLSLYIYSIKILTANEARAVFFVTLVLTNISLLFSLLSYKNKILWILCSIAILFLTIIVNVPFFVSVFQFEKIPLNFLGLAVLTSVISFFLFKFINIYTRREN